MVFTLLTLVDFDEFNYFTMFDLTSFKITIKYETFEFDFDFNLNLTVIYLNSIDSHSIGVIIAITLI